ncbi:MAG: hypothetical protein CR976_01390 [Thiotrichales bacterium]|nr:MAG: hypothetical protein CR976_01390 [Thiotrichales bacterium]
MFSLGSFLIGMLVAWLLEWLYVYLTSHRPRNNPMKQLEAQMQEAEQAHTDETTKLIAEITSLQAQLEKLAHENEVAVAEADGLRGELETMHCPMTEGRAEEVVEADDADTLDKDTVLEEEFAAAMAVTEPEAADIETASVAITEDDLTLITGIGPKTAELLHQSGVTSFIQLAEMSAEDLHEFLQEHNIPHSRAKVAGWPKQARKLATDI